MEKVSAPTLKDLALLPPEKKKEKNFFVCRSLGPEIKEGRECVGIGFVISSLILSKRRCWL